MNNTIDKTVNSPKFSRLCLVSGLHKPGIPSRPIVSSCGSPTENISRFVNHFLQLLVRTLPFYIWDTTDFLQKLQELPVLPLKSLLETLDVSSLYTNTLHDEGINACEEFLNTRTDQSPPIRDLCQLILHSIFSRNVVIKLQQCMLASMCQLNDKKYQNKSFDEIIFQQYFACFQAGLH